MKTASEKLAALRDEMARSGVQGYLVPRSDEFLGEYVPESAERLAWLTGFTGSAGFAVVLEARAAVFSDSRYTIQLGQQIDNLLFEAERLKPSALKGWIERHGVRGITMGFDPELHSVAEIKQIEVDLAPFDITLKPIVGSAGIAQGNLIDRIWTHRPGAPRSSVEPFLEVFAGRSAAQKREQIADDLQRDGYAAAILPDPLDMAWLLNIRGRDVVHTPVALSFGIIYADSSVDWVIDPARVDAEIARSLGNAVRIVPPEGVSDMIMKLKARAGRDPVLMDEHKTTYRLAQLLDDRNVNLKFGKDPCCLPRACKNEAEQQAMRDAHRKDGVAVVRFLYWLAQEALIGKITEITIDEKLKFFRAKDPAWRDSSFDTIAGMGPNGAIVHYRAMPETARVIGPDGLLLIDSGAQYACGTTDITRVVAIGTPDSAMRDHYTKVLKAHIAMADAIFPAGTTGVQIDTITRTPLWRAGMDFAHGTGHGVGVYLSVHEDGVSISSRGTGVLQPGMIVSDEPGYYLEGQYGIRLENLVLVKSSDRVAGQLEFETLTLVPFEPHLVKMSALTQDEKDWLAAYHTRVRDVIGPLLPDAERAWLDAVCGYFM